MDNLTITLGQSILIVLCAGSTSTGAVDTFKSIFFSYWFDNLGFIWRETCCCTHHTFLLGSPNERVCHVLSWGEAMVDVAWANGGMLETGVDVAMVDVA